VTLVLVVEDEESFSDPLSYMLRKEGFEVAVCPTGLDALAAFDRSGADLVLLDVMLPGPAGTEVCRSLRERSDVPVIMLSAKDGEIDRAVGLGLGADDYVIKPFSWHELLVRIRAVLRSRGKSGNFADNTGGAPDAHRRRQAPGRHEWRRPSCRARRIPRGAVSGKTAYPRVARHRQWGTGRGRSPGRCQARLRR
jgi:DNA-binding response OmpR family regulator